MSWTKTEHWDAICEMMGGRGDEPEYLNWWAIGYDETAIDWFPDFRLSFDGYAEFDCELCGKPNIVPTPHKECHDEENARVSELGDDDLPF